MNTLVQINFWQLRQAFTPGSLPSDETLSLGAIISWALTFIFVIAGLLLLLYLLYGGFRFLTSRGDPGAVKEGQGIITTAIVGFVIIFTAYWVIQIVGIIFNIQAIKETFG